MRRRDVIGLLGGAAVAWPVGVRAQQPTMPLVGFLRSTSLAVSIPAISGFRQGLKEAGLNEGQNVAIELRYADNQIDQLPALVRELIARQPTVIVANVLAALAAKEVTAKLPIVFVTGSDPVVDGLVPNLNRPGGNVTGISFVSGALGAKRLEMLRQVVPTADTIALLVGHGTLEAMREREDVLAAAQMLGQKLIKPGSTLRCPLSGATRVKRSYPKASILKASRVVFNIKGNDYRLVTRLQYQAGVLAIRFFGTHSDYDRIDAGCAPVFTFQPTCSFHRRKGCCGEVQGRSEPRPEVFCPERRRLCERMVRSREVSKLFVIRPLQQSGGD